MKSKIIDTYIDTLSYPYFIRRIIALAQTHSSAYVCVANVHMLIEAHKDESFATILNKADLVTPDGMPLAKGLNLLYDINQDRVAGMDLLPDLLEQAERLKLRVFFYGGTSKMQETTSRYIKNRHPFLVTTGFHSPPFRPLTGAEEDNIIEKVNNSHTHLVVVALGCPKQEKWMASMKGRINSCMIGIGGALPVMVGLQSRAPVWMQRYSLEWLYRLCQEPKRLWKRYFITNSLFIFLFAKQYISMKVARRGKNARMDQ